MALLQFQRELRLIQLTFDETRDILLNGEIEDVEYHYKRLCESVNKLESFKDNGATVLMDDNWDDEDNTVEIVRAWNQDRSDDMKEVREMRTKVKRRLQSLEEEQTKQRETTQLESQRKIAEEQARYQRQQQQEIEQSKMKQQQREEAWYKRRAELEMELLQNKTKELGTQPQAVKLQKYTITPFEGDFKDWIRFWNQFEVEVDQSRLSEISKFNYLLELVKGRPRDDVLGLPHTAEGYEEAKRILKSNYGKDIKVHKALIKELENLPTITNRTRLRDTHEFYNTFARVVRTLKTMNKIDTVQSHIYGIFDKLGPVREAIVQNEDKWEEWKLEDLMEHLRRYVDRNPLVERETTKQQHDQRHVSLHEQAERVERVMFSNNVTEGKKVCVYCSSNTHRSNDCTKVLSIANRKEFLRKNKLCFNCTGSSHTAAKCRSGVCRKCRGKHHTSLCENTTSTIPNSETRTSTDKSMGVVEKTTTIHATVVAKVNGVDARIMIDNGASSSYICTELLTKLRLKPDRYEKKLIEQMYGIVEKRVERYTVEISSPTMKHFKFNVDCINAEKEILTHVANPNIREIKGSQPRLSPLRFSEENSIGESLPVHIVLGVADYQRIKTTEPPVLGKNPDKDPGAEFTMLGWVLQGGTINRQSEIEHTFLLNSNHDEIDKLCSMEVLGIKDESNSCSVSDEEFLKEFNSNLHIAESGHSSTRLPWKDDCADLPTNKDLAKRRLISTTRRLEKIGRLSEYDSVMQDQIKQGIIEEVKDESTNTVQHYIPHHAVIRDEAESTKMRVVYDCSAKQDDNSPSLNDCLEVGPALQPHLFDVLLRNRTKSYCLTGDIKQAFLQIEVDPIDRDALRLFWYKDLTTREILTYRFTRVIFGSASSPFILGATINKHVSSFCDDYPETAKGLLENTYVDDIQFVSDERHALQDFKRESTEILSSAGFKLHKWHSNVDELENNDKERTDDSETTLAKGLVGTHNNETKLLGVPWKKDSDEISVNFNKCLERAENHCVTKRTIISVINSVFDILGFITPVLIIAKLLFSKVCTLKLTWDEEIPSDLLNQWKRWIKELKQCVSVSVPRCCLLFSRTRQIFLHGFSDASKYAVCAAVYVLTKAADGTSSQHLLVSKSRVAPKGLTIPRLELVGAFLLVKLLTHVKQTLKDYQFQRICGWTDSTTVLYWLHNRGTWSKFVRNRVSKMAEADFIEWYYVPTAVNPSDLGTRGAYPRQLTSLWFHGPTWLPNDDDWPEQPEALESDNTLKETEQDTGAVSSTLLACDKENLPLEFQQLLQRPYWQMLRITAYVKRFINNCLHPQMKITCSLTTEEINSAENSWFYMAQTTMNKEERAELVKGDDNLLRRNSRIPGYSPIHLPRDHLFTTRLIEHHHEKSLHGGVSVTMCRIRKQLWIPKLRSLVKSVIYKCNKCKRFRAKPVGTPPTSNLPKFRTELSTPFDVTGVDFAGPLLYKTVNGESSKCYVALFTCTCTRAIHLKLCKDLSAEAFQHALREFLARRGTPNMMVSDNGKNFVATGKWIKTLKHDDTVMNFLATHRIKWRFNLARAPWWGGFFERLIGVMKRALSKVIGKGLLKYEELEDVLLDIECHVNNRPLTYQGEEMEQPVLTPNILIRGAPTTFLEEDIDQLEEDTVTTRRIAHLQKCKQDLKKRWTTEYLQALEEKHAPREKSEEYQIPRKNSVVLLKEDTKKRVQWKLARVLREIHGKDGVVRGLELKLGNGYTVQRPLQLICNLEITPCDNEPQPAVRVPDVGQTEPLVPQRNRRAAANLAREKIAAIIQAEQEEI